MEIRPFLCDNIDKALVRSEWERWFRSFSLYLQAEDISDVAKKKNKLLHLGGPQLQEVAFNIPGALVEGNEELNSFEVLVAKLDEYFSPKRNSTFERHLFRNLSPVEGENFNKYLLRLRHQVSKCEFGKTAAEINEICIKDKIIDSWAPVDLKKKLLEKEQSLKEIVETCQIYEQISKQSGSMFTKSADESVNRITTKLCGARQNNDECGRCGQKGHFGNDPKCPARSAQCNKCGLIGHFARKCRSKKRKSGYNRNSPKRKRTESYKVRNVGTNEEEEVNCFKISNDTGIDEKLVCGIGGCPISMVIDSGTRLNLVSESDWGILRKNKAVIFNEREDHTTQFKAYASNKVLDVLQVFEAPISVENKLEKIATFYVIKNGCQSLLGRNTAMQLGVLKVGLGVNSIEIAQPFPKMLGVKIKLSIDPTVKPVQQPMRRIPIALEEQVEEKIKQMIALDIIEPVSGPSSWISPIVIVYKEGGEMRLCIDMRRANHAVLRENHPLPTFEMFMAKLRGAKSFLGST
ncbi:uncharacterized protein LOC125779294 [Bactrocera dorsalis]|uniref:Uncharacterized protein LOC125779294 n=1 Tax=Bactrocera dorsalis TaxID=27457 RepID=A0ABM3K4W0_BACDO|nr:uncharacterized protein LOC125779294 [Bactrocera dorsalis]